MLKNWINRNKIEKNCLNFCLIIVLFLLLFVNAVMLSFPCPLICGNGLIIAIFDFFKKIQLILRSLYEEKGFFWLRKPKSLLLFSYCIDANRLPKNQTKTFETKAFFKNMCCSKRYFLGFSVLFSGDDRKFQLFLTVFELIFQIFL